VKTVQQGLEHKKEFNMKKIFLVMFTLILYISGYSFIVMNDINCSFNEGPEKILLEDNVILGATHFLNSKSNADLLLMEYEKSGRQEFNFTLALEYVEKAIAELEISKEKYVKATEIGERLGYIETKQSWFKEFNYDTFIVENNLNREIAGIVKGYLIKGDVLGVYRHNLDNIDGILTTLSSIRDQVKIGKKPDISIFWNLLQQYSEATLFGNYSTVIGRQILSKSGSEQCEG
jgi:hypothetical protein